MTVRTREQLLAELGRRELDRAVAAGRWQRVLRGAYAPAGPVDLGVRARAACCLLPPTCVVADRSLLWLLGVDVLPTGPPVLEVVVPRGAVVPRRAGVRARTAALPSRDRVVLAGVPALRPARAVADLLRALPFVEAVVVADAAQRVRLCTRDGLASELERHAGLRGVRQARRALVVSDPRAESPPETRLRLLLTAAGLAPVPQHDVHDADGRWLARVDLAFPAARLAVEYDGRDAHLTGGAFVRERRRQNALLAAGWTVLRYTAADLRSQPYAVVAEVRRALARAA